LRDHIVKCGYPPRIFTAPDSSTLDSAGIKNGETILVDKLILPPEPVSVETPLIEPHSSVSAQTSSSSSPPVFQSTPAAEPKTAAKNDVISVQTRNGYLMLRVGYLETL
jgi:hypothetical protein